MSQAHSAPFAHLAAVGDGPSAPYTRGIEVLVLCTANQCRSPMAEILLRDRLAAAGVDAVVRSAGELPGGAPASAGSVRAMAARGLDLGGHVSQTLSPGMIDRADLVLTMARRHLRSAVAMSPDAFRRTFTLRELVRRADAVGWRESGEPLEQWLDRLHAGRVTTQLLGEHSDDDVDDPIGGPDHLYEQTAVELSALIDRFIEAAFQHAENRESA